MKVTELNREQLVELKQAMLSQSSEQPSYGELAKADELISDQQALTSTPAPSLRKTILHVLRYESIRIDGWRLCSIQVYAPRN